MKGQNGTSPQRHATPMRRTGRGYAQSRSDWSDWEELKDYRQVIGYPPLTDDEEQTLPEAIARGDLNALHRMIMANLKLVIHIAKKYMGRGLALCDLVGAGNVGLTKAARGFVPGLARFSTFACACIAREMTAAIRLAKQMIRISDSALKMLKQHREAELALKAELGRDPSFEEVAQSWGLSRFGKKVVAAAHRVAQPALETELINEDDRRTLGDLGGTSEAPELEPERADDLSPFCAKMDRLTPRQQAVIRLRYGLENGRPVTLQVAAFEMGITRQRAKQLEDEAIRKLREYLPQQKHFGVRYVAALA